MPGASAAGPGNVITTWANAYFGRAVEDLADALERTRDYLYESGQNLITIADNYAETEAVHAEEAEAIKNRLKEIDPEIRGTLADIYRPPPPTLPY